MLTTLFVLVSHNLFAWSCRGSKADLVRNFGEIVKDFGLVPDVSTSSTLFKGASKLYNLARKKKNARKSQETVIKCEEETLKAFEIDLGDLKTSEEEDQNQSRRAMSPYKDLLPEVKESKLRGKRKNFDELKSSNKKRARVRSIIEILEEDTGLEKKVRQKLEMRKVDQKSDVEDFDISCLALMKIMDIKNS